MRSDGFVGTPFCNYWGFHHASDSQLGGIYDASSFEWVPVRWVADIIGGLTGAKVIAGDCAGSTPITPMRGKIPGWSASVSLEAGLVRMIEVYR